MDIGTDVLSHAPTITTAAWTLFAIACVVFAVVSVVLLYHWNTYGMSNRHIVFARTLYLVVAVGILGIALVALMFIS